MITYAEQLQSPEWKRKRFHILQRDNFHCQHCGTFGISGYNIFIPLSTLYDIDSYINAVSYTHLTLPTTSRV